MDIGSLGSLLIIVGLVMVVMQFIRDLTRNTFPTRSLQAGLNHFKLTATYPGLILVCIGAILTLVAHLYK
jgi:hypothetical protein